MLVVFDRSSAAAKPANQARWDAIDPKFTTCKSAIDRSDWGNRKNLTCVVMSLGLILEAC